MRYPTFSDGRIVPVTDLGYDIVPFERKYTNRHHYWYNKSEYQDKRYKQVFRGLLSHVAVMPLIQHNDLHDNFTQPRMPSDIAMLDVIEEYLSMYGVIDVVRETRTCETYQILPDQWNSIRATYKG